MNNSLFIAEVAQIMEKHNLFVANFKIENKDGKIFIVIEGKENES